MKVFVLAALALLAAPVQADTVRVKGHIKKDGTYVPPHVRTSPNKTTTDNWGSKPNVNPTTGKKGTADPYKAPKPPRF